MGQPQQKQQPINWSKTIQNILIAAAFGILVAMTMRLLKNIFPGLIPQIFVTGAVGAVIGGGFVFLVKRL